MGKKKPFQLFFQNGLGVYTGAVDETKIHTHFATEIIIGLDGPFLLQETNKESLCHSVLIPHKVAHRFVQHGCKQPLFIFLDPFHHLSQQLVNHFCLKEESVLLDQFLTGNQMTLIQNWANEFNNVVSNVETFVGQLTGDDTSLPTIDPRIIKSINHIKNSLHKEMKLDQMADLIHLSPSRYAHLFKEQVGIPFRRFVLWTRMQATIGSILNGQSLTTACYVGGFSDLPHFSKIFVEMFGVAPSSVIKG